MRWQNTKVLKTYSAKTFSGYCKYCTLTQHVTASNVWSPNWARFGSALRSCQTNVSSRPLGNKRNTMCHQFMNAQRDTVNRYYSTAQPNVTSSSKSVYRDMFWSSPSQRTRWAACSSLAPLRSSHAPPPAIRHTIIITANFVMNNAFTCLRKKAFFTRFCPGCLWRRNTEWQNCFQELTVFVVTAFS